MNPKETNLGRLVGDGSTNFQNQKNDILGQEGEAIKEIKSGQTMKNHENTFLERFYGMKFGKLNESDKSCHIWQDISILTGEKRENPVNIIEEPNHQIGQGYSSQMAMGLASNEGKELRLMRLKNAIDYQGIKTSNEAYEVMGHEVTNEKTLIQYLRKIKRNLRSSIDGKLLGLSDVMVRKAIEAEKERESKTIHYYDGDPSLPTTREITKEEFEKLKIQNIKKYKKK